MKISLFLLLAVLGLSLITWWYFYQSGNPLESSETSLIVGFYLATVLLVRQLWVRIRKPGSKNDQNG